MRTFFHGWRRKVGCVTLALAMFVGLLWVRTMVMSDQVLLGVRDRTYSIGSCRGGIFVCIFSISSTDTWEWVTVSEKKLRLYIGNLSLPAMLVDEFSYPEVVYWYAMYWQIVLSLTLLSGYLILWKPRNWLW